MNIDQFYKQAKERMKLVLPLNDISKQQADIKKQYIEKLIQTTKYYPEYKLSNTPDMTMKYNTSLSELNGLDKQVVTLNEKLHKNMTQVSTSLTMINAEIKDLQITYDNLKNYTSFDLLDPTSKRMLLDYVSIYNDQRKIFWMKAIVVGIIIYLLIIKEKNMMYVLSLFIGVIILYIIMGIYHAIKNRVSMPSGAAPSGSVAQTNPEEKACSSCGSTTYGCCPDGITESNEDRSNC